MQQVRTSLEAPYDELFTALPPEARLNIDETGHPDQGQQWWTWCFRAPLDTVFHIDAACGTGTAARDP